MVDESRIPWPSFPPSVEPEPDLAQVVLSEFRRSDFLKTILRLVETTEKASNRSVARSEEIIKFGQELPRFRVLNNKESIGGLQGRGKDDVVLPADMLPGGVAEDEDTRANTPNTPIQRRSKQAVESLHLEAAKIRHATHENYMEADSMEALSSMKVSGARSMQSTASFLNLERDMQADYPVKKQPKEHVPVFADADYMKEQVRLAVTRKQYKVEDLYHSTGYAQAIARNPYFEMVTLGIIALNSLWISVDIDLNDAVELSEAALHFRIVENCFLVYFFLEWLIRFLAFERKLDGLTDGWFVFDTLLVVLMVLDTYLLPFALKFTSLKSGAGDTSVLKLLRMTRITRMARMVRLLKALPELTILVKGIWVAARSVFFTLCLLSIIIYIFAVAFRQLTDGMEVGKLYFKSVPESMSSLLLHGVLPDQAEMVNNISKEHFIFGIMALVFILLASLTVMNMLVGVLVEVVSVVSSVEKEELKVRFVESKLRIMLESSGLDTDLDMNISRQEFDLLLIKPAAAKIIQDVGVDPVGLVDFAEFIFEDCPPEGLSFSDFIGVILQFRGSNNATVRDVVDLRKSTMNHFLEIKDSITWQTSLIKRLLRGLAASDIGAGFLDPIERSCSANMGSTVSCAWLPSPREENGSPQAPSVCLPNPPRQPAPKALIVSQEA